jgi:hypothetical protein
MRKGIDGHRFERATGFRFFLLSLAGKVINPLARV